jgi:hypothetical protein
VSNTGIFAIGLFVTLLLGGGLGFTIYEMRRIYNDSIKEAARSKDL